MKKTASTHCWILAAVCCCMLLCAIPSSAAESDATNATPKIDNVGFMNNPPKELVDRFPMCDEFLNVEWIDEDKRIGLAIYSLYKQDGKIGVKYAKSIIDLDPEYMYWRYSANEYYLTETKSSGDQKVVFKKRGLKNIFQFIQKGSVVRHNILLRVENGDESIELTPVDDYPGNWTLANYKKNICIVYPNNKNAWLVEKKFATASNKETIKKKLTNAHFWNEDFYSKFFNDWFEQGIFPVDLNKDGIQDYFSGTTSVYSVGNEYYQVVPGDDDHTYYFFPPHDKKCQLLAPMGFTLTTNGTTYLLNNQCSLKEMTLGGK